MQHYNPRWLTTRVYDERFPQNRVLTSLNHQVNDRLTPEQIDTINTTEIQVSQVVIPADVHDGQSAVPPVIGKVSHNDML